MLESSYIIAAAALLGLAALIVIARAIRGRASGHQDALPDSSGVSFLSGLLKTRSALSAALSKVFAGDVSSRSEALEEALIAADVGVKTAMDVVADLDAAAMADEVSARAGLREALLERLKGEHQLVTRPEKPLVVLVVGVNGSGKTTTIGKLAHRYKTEGQSVLLAAGDTFRAGAIEQLQVWGERVGVPVVAHQEGADPAAVIYDGIEAGVARGVDVIICDTAGRLQAQSQLMDELGKVVRVMDKALPGCPHEVLLVLDATIGQNALSQARSFKDIVGATGVVLTKLDGTARGGVVVAVGAEMGLPVKLIGLGEGIDDLRLFEPEPFVDALLANDGLTPATDPR